mgnify:CR=1 FL=1
MASKIAIDEGIDEVIEWIEEHFHELRKLPLDYIHKV